MIRTIYILERITGYTIAGSGWCSDYSELPEGGYNTRISNENPLHHEDRIRECMNRCIDASARGAIPSLSSSYGNKIGDLAFFIRDWDQGCGCSSGTCFTTKTYSSKNDDFTSYHVSGKTLIFILKKGNYVCLIYDTIP